MWQRNNGQEESEILQNHFTAYVMTAIQRKRDEYAHQLWRHQEMEQLIVDVQTEQSYASEQEMLEELPLLWRLENDALLCALKEISERERHVFLSRVLDEKDFETIASELGLSYKGAAAVYYRTIGKIKKRMGELE